MSTPILTNDELKTRVSVIDAAERLTQVWPDGPARWVCRCLCGKSTDRTPSFKLWADHAHCFSCHVHIANVFQLVMLARERQSCFGDRASFLRAREWLIGEFIGAGGAGRSLAAPQPRLESRQPPLASPEIKALLNATVAHYEQALWRDGDGDGTTLAYLRHKRGLNEVTLRCLRVGYADNRGLARALYRQGIDLALAARAGVLSSDDKGEFLRGRIVFPVLDAAGDAVYLIGRGTQAWQARTKYLGLPQTLLRKLPMITGAPTRGVILVEGPVDFAALMQWRLDAKYLLVCSLGTAHARALDAIQTHAPVSPVFLACDMDAAGEAAALKIAERLGSRASRLRWGGAKDCGELLAQGGVGEAVFRQALANAIDQQRIACVSQKQLC